MPRKGFGLQAFTESFGGRNWGGGARPRRVSFGRVAADPLSDSMVATGAGSVEIHSEQPLEMLQLAPSSGWELSGQQGSPGTFALPVASALKVTASCQSAAAVRAWVWMKADVENTNTSSSAMQKCERGFRTFKTLRR